MVMPVAPTVPPGTADLGFTFAADDVRGVTVVDLALDPSGELVYLAGPARLAQDVMIWLLVPQGADQTDPTFGNPLYALIGRPGYTDPITTLLAMVQQAEGAFLARQAQEVAAGTRTTDEQVQAFLNTQVTPLYPDGTTPAPTVGQGVSVPPSAFRVTFTILTVAGSAFPTGGTVPGAALGVPPPPPTVGARYGVSLYGGVAYGT